MRGIRSDQLVRQQANYNPNEVKEQSLSIRNDNKSRRFLAKRIVYNKKNLYKYNMFIGDSKTPVGVFELTLSDAAKKNKEYRDKMFFSNDENYRLKMLKLTKDSIKEVDNDIHNTMCELRLRERSTTNP